MADTLQNNVMEGRSLRRQSRRLYDEVEPRVAAVFDRHQPDMAKVRVQLRRVLVRITFLSS